MLTHNQNGNYKEKQQNSWQTGRKVLRVVSEWLSETICFCLFCIGLHVTGKSILVLMILNGAVFVIPCEIWASCVSSHRNKNCLHKCLFWKKKVMFFKIFFTHCLIDRWTLKWSALCQCYIAIIICYILILSLSATTNDFFFHTFSLIGDYFLDWFI